MRLISPALLLLALLIQTTGAGAQSSTQARTGFFIGVGAGYGSLKLGGWPNSRAGIGSSLQLGGTVNERLLLGVSIDAWVGDRDDDLPVDTASTGSLLRQTSWSALARFYPNAGNGFFIRGGVGHIELSWFEDRDTFQSFLGFSANAGLGYDARVSANWSLTPYAGLLLGRGFNSGSFNSYAMQIGIGIIRH